MDENLANAGNGGSMPSASPISGSQPSNAPSTPATSPEASPANDLRSAFESAQRDLDPERGNEPARQHPPGKPRGPDGKFAGTQPDHQKTVSNDPNAAAQIKALEAPKRWPDARKAVFANLSPEAQQAWLDSDTDWNKGFDKQAKDFSSHKQFAEQVRGMFTPDLQAAMQKAGMDELAGVKHSLQLVSLFNKDPVSFIRGWMDRNKVDPRVFLPTSAGPDGQAALGVDALAPILNPLRSKLETLEAAEAQRQQAANAERDQVRAAAIREFAAEVDETGASKRPHLERVADEMISILKHNPRFTGMDPRKALDEAYNAAVRADPELMEELVTAKANQRLAAMEQERTTNRLDRSATVKPQAPATGGQIAATGLQAAFQDARRQLGKR